MKALPINGLSQSDKPESDRIEPGGAKESNETMANLTPHKKINPHQPHSLHADQTALIASMLDHFDGFALVTDGNGRIVYANRSAARLSGFSRSEIKGGSLENLFDLTAKQQTSIKQCFDGKTSASFETTGKTKAGVTFAVQFKVAPLNPEAEVCGLVVFAVDISHEVRLERQLRQAQKMEAIGTLAGGIAHDFNNLLMGIQGNISLSLLDIKANSPFVKNLKKIEQYIQNGVDLTKQLLGFARGGKYEISLLNLNALLEEQNLMFSRTNKEIIFKNESKPDLWSVEADRGQIEQVLMNLYLNALQAMPDGGALTTRTANVTIEKDHYSPYYVKAGKYIRMTIEDAGVGMDEDIQQRIFDPFFTTKEMGRGTGLGLASVYGIVKNHEGFINVFSKKGQGTRFEIYLPASGKGVPLKEKTSEQFVEGRETVLLVDDEDMIIDVGTRMLNKLGYKVFTARDGREAIGVFQKHQGKIDVIVLDMIMPQMGGGETYDRIKKITPGVKVLLSSGYSINGQASEILNRGCNGFIQKPFNLQDLSQSLRTVLEGK
jgi:PAS domain S-box-containing protein